HVVSGRLTAADVAKLDGKSIKTVEGSPAAIDVEAGTVLVGRATVTRADVPARNGGIHVIDAVLLPPTGTRADHSRPAASRVRPKPADGDAPLAEGFPDATRPGAIEVKKYPAYRSAVARSREAAVSSGDLLFFSLFNHIQRKRIEMTAPVINT